MELIKTKWSDVTIQEYFDIVEISQDEGIDELSRDVEVIAILCGVAPEDIWNLPVTEVGELRRQINWLASFDFDKKEKHFKTINIAGEECTALYNTTNMTYAQFVDFQTAWKNGVDSADNMALVLSSLITPKGKKYNDGYDLDELREAIKNNMPITTAQSICFFFLKQSVNSYNFMMLYLRVMMMWMKMKMMWRKIWKKQTDLEKEMTEKLGQAIIMMKEMEHIVGSRY